MNKPNEQPHEWPQGYQQPPQPVIQQQPAGKLEALYFSCPLNRPYHFQAIQFEDHLEKLCRSLYVAERLCLCVPLCWNLNEINTVFAT